MEGIIRVSDYFIGREIEKRKMWDKLKSLFAGREKDPMWLATLEIIVEMKERIEALETGRG